VGGRCIRPTPEELENFGTPDFTIYNAGQFPCNRYTHYMTSSTSIDINLGRREMVILGTQYAGEMKKGLFSVMHYLMPKRQILSLHSGCNMGKDGDVALFFGLSGIVSPEQGMMWLQMLPYDMSLLTLISPVLEP
jgi:phosphoenolpyruvate carboxykinase (ATP)